MARGRLMRWLLGPEKSATLTETQETHNRDKDSRVEALRTLEGLRVRAEVRLGREIPREALEIPYDDSVYRGTIS